MYSPLCGIFHLDWVVIARCDVLIREKPSAMMMHVLQKAFFKHAPEQRMSLIWLNIAVISGSLRSNYVYHYVAEKNRID